MQMFEIKTIRIRLPCIFILLACTVLFFYCCITDYHKVSSLKQHHLLSHNLWMSFFFGGGILISWVLFLRSHQGEIKVSSRAVITNRSSSTSSNLTAHEQNLLSCTCMTEFLAVLQAALPGGSIQFLSHGHLQKLSHSSDLSTFKKWLDPDKVSIRTSPYRSSLFWLTQNQLRNW